MNLKNSYEAFTDSQSGDEMFEETFRLFPDTGKYNIEAGAWNSDTDKAERHILELFITNHGELIDADRLIVSGLIFHDLTGQ